MKDVHIIFKLMRQNRVQELKELLTSDPTVVKTARYPYKKKEGTVLRFAYNKLKSVYTYSNNVDNITDMLCLLIVLVKPEEDDTYNEILNYCVYRSTVYSTKFLKLFSTFSGSNGFKIPKKVYNIAKHGNFINEEIKNSILLRYFLQENQ